MSVLADHIGATNQIALRTIDWFRPTLGRRTQVQLRRPRGFDRECSIASARTKMEAGTFL